ncbi:MAG: homoserine O-acetyltransferase MetX [Nocardioides sp.]
MRVRLFTPESPLRLHAGGVLEHVEVSYQTWGDLDPDRGNAVFVAHALTGDSFACGSAGHPGWWDTMVGPGRPVDTDRFFVICPNLLGGCQGTTGPSSVDPATGRPYGLDFPLVDIEDLVAVHRALLAHLGIDRLYAGIGGSQGGMQILQWALEAPTEIARAVLVAASSRLTAQNIALSAVARAAILDDPGFNPYPDKPFDPEAGATHGRIGLGLARMLGHVTYLSAESMDTRFGRRYQDGESRRSLGVDFAVESYLYHQRESFLARFDPLSYLYLTRSLDHFDPFAAADALDAVRTAGAEAPRFLVLSFDSDWRFSTAHSRRIVERLAGVEVTFAEIRSPYGHDSFLLDIPEYLDSVRAFLAPPR